MDWGKVNKPGSYRDLYRYYGNPGSANFENIYIQEFPHTIAGGKVVRIRSHAALVLPLHNVFAALQKAGAVDLIQSCDGCFEIRAIRGGSKPSLHSWGLAIDVNAGLFPLGSTARQNETLAKAFADAGFFWGGDFHRRPDPMHWQWTLPHTI